MTKVAILGHQIVTTQLNQVDIFEKELKPTPVDLLEKAVAACIGLELLKFYTIEKLPIDTFTNVKVVFSNESIKIICRCNKQFEEKFKEIVANCYISKNVVFPKYIQFDEHLDMN